MASTFFLGLHERYRKVRLKGARWGARVAVAVNPETSRLCQAGFDRPRICASRNMGWGVTNIHGQLACRVRSEVVGLGGRHSRAPRSAGTVLDPATLSLHDALPICLGCVGGYVLRFHGQYVFLGVARKVQKSPVERGQVGCTSSCSREPRDKPAVSSRIRPTQDLCFQKHGLGCDEHPRPVGLSRALRSGRAGGPSLPSASVSRHCPGPCHSFPTRRSSDLLGLCWRVCVEVPWPVRFSWGCTKGTEKSG